MAALISSEVITDIKKYLYRLDSSATNERLEALQQLQSLAKRYPSEVGDCISRILSLLYEPGSAEEYQESLDILLRLISCRDESIAEINVNRLLESPKSVELFLDLLEHEDLTVAVMVNQILTEIHLRKASTLEGLIQESPAGMNKLLQRLSDHSREEVRNQALVFVQQLTSSNEEMKKTVVFNEVRQSATHFAVANLYYTICLYTI